MGTLTVPIHPLVIFHIISSRDVFHPLLVVQIPTDRLDNSGFERSFRCPAQFVCNLCRINGITMVMAQTVFYKSNQAVVDPVDGNLPVRTDLFFFRIRRYSGCSVINRRMVLIVNFTISIFCFSLWPPTL